MSAERLRAAATRLREDDATMHPGVALALADWLDTTANDAQHVHDPLYNLLTSTTVSRALLVADAVLGGEER